MLLMPTMIHLHKSMVIYHLYRKGQSRGQGDHPGVEGGAAAGEARAQGGMQPTLRVYLPHAQG